MNQNIMKRVVYLNNNSMRTFSNDICEISLRWVLAVRRNSDIHDFDIKKINKKTHPEIFGDKAGDFHHTQSTLLWSVSNARESGNTGLTQWLQTKSAYGYMYWLNKNNFTK